MKKYVNAATKYDPHGIDYEDDAEGFCEVLHDEFLVTDDNIQDKLEEFREYWTVDMENIIVDSFELYDKRAEIEPDEFDKIIDTLQYIISCVEEFEDYYNKLRKE